MSLSACIPAAFLYCAALLAPATAQQPSPARARVELLARQDAIIAGRDLQLGIHFVLEPGWHIYWINPGDSGQPPTLKWQLPAGFSAGEIEWPRPERMQTTAQLADYGYHGEVLLPVTVHVPSSASAGSPVQIAAEAKWLVCREVCIPEHAQLHLELPVAQSAKDNPQSAALFASTQKLLPQAMPQSWKATLMSNKSDLFLLLKTGKQIKKAEFFPLEPNQIDNPAPQRVQPAPAGVMITLKKSDLLMKPVEVLRGVLVVPDGTVYRIEAPRLQPIK
jgi:thiol:disulfide interchange protein DsbD